MNVINHVTAFLCLVLLATVCESRKDRRDLLLKKSGWLEIDPHTLDHQFPFVTEYIGYLSEHHDRAKLDTGEPIYIKKAKPVHHGSDVPEDANSNVDQRYVSLVIDNPEDQGRVTSQHCLGRLVKDMDVHYVVSSTCQDPDNQDE